MGVRGKGGVGGGFEEILDKSGGLTKKGDISRVAWTKRGQTDFKERVGGFCYLG